MPVNFSHGILPYQFSEKLCSSPDRRSQKTVLKVPFIEINPAMFRFFSQIAVGEEEYHKFS
jgi:hypothetical protein